MSNELINNDNEINNIFDNIKDLVINSRNKVYQTVNTEMLSLYWNIGKAIMEIKQDDENPTVGILLSTNKNETVVKYTLPEDNKTIFSSEYKYICQLNKN